MQRVSDKGMGQVGFAGTIAERLKTLIDSLASEGNSASGR